MRRLRAGIHFRIMEEFELETTFKGLPTHLILPLVKIFQGSPLCPALPATLTPILEIPKILLVVGFVPFQPGSSQFGASSSTRPAQPTFSTVWANPGFFQCMLCFKTSFSTQQLWYEEMNWKRSFLPPTTLKYFLGRSLAQEVQGLKRSRGRK